MPTTDLERILRIYDRPEYLVDWGLGFQPAARLLEELGACEDEDTREYVVEGDPDEEGIARFYALDTHGYRHAEAAGRIIRVALYAARTPREDLMPQQREALTDALEWLRHTTRGVHVVVDMGIPGALPEPETPAHDAFSAKLGSIRDALERRFPGADVTMRTITGTGATTLGAAVQPLDEALERAVASVLYDVEHPEQAKPWFVLPGSPPSSGE